MTSGWAFVVVAGGFEIVMALCLKYSNGFKNLLPSLLTLVTLFFSFYFLSIALRSIPLSSAYAIWTGIGAVGTFLIGVFIFGDALNTAKVIFLLLTLFGIVGLKLSS